MSLRENPDVAKKKIVLIQAFCLRPVSKADAEGLGTTIYFLLFDAM
jgi:hypothetical protein